MYEPDGSPVVESVVAGAVEAVVGAVVAVVGGAVVAVGRGVGVGRVVGDVVDGGVVVEGVGLVGVVVAVVSVELSDPVLSPESVELLLSVESVPPEPLFDLRPFDFLSDLLSEDFSPDDVPSDDFLSDAAVGTLAASAGLWSGGAGTASATPPPTDRPATISSAPVPASA